MAMNKSRGALAAAVAALCACGAALAQTTLPQVTVEDAAERADGPVRGYRAGRSATFTKTDTPLKDVPASVTVVPADLMKDQAMQSMGDVFRYVPGVLTHQGESNRDQIILRGNSTTADFFVDGVRDDAQIFRDLYNLERVEVLKGPGGMIFGRGGAGGVVNRVTKRPVFDRIAEAALTVGSYNQLRGTLDVGGKLSDAFALRLNAMAEGVNSFTNDVNLHRFAINPTAVYLFDAQTAITVSYERLHDQRVPNRGFPSRNGAPFDADPAVFFGNASQSVSRQHTDGLHAVLDHEFGNGAQLKNTLRVTKYDKYYQNVYAAGSAAFNNGAVTPAGTVSLGAYNNLNQRENVFNQTDLTLKFSAGGLEHNVLAGVEIGTQDSANKRNTGFFGAAANVFVPVGNPIAVTTRFAPLATDADNRTKANMVGVYLQDQITLTAQWKVLAGLRYDRFKVDFTDRRMIVPVPANFSRTDSAISPRLGLIWAPTARSTYYASYSYAFLPSAEQLGLAATTASLEPETANNYEIGARWDLQPKLTLSAAVFRTDKDRVRAADPANPGFFIKTGQQRTEGVEFGLQGDVARGWQVFGGFTLLNGRVMQPFNSGTTAAVATTIQAGNRLQLTPQRTLSLWNKFDLGSGWGAGIGVIHQSKSFTTLGNTVQLPGFSRVDGAIYYAFNGGKTRLAFNLENLFDRRYFPTADGDNNISPGAPRNGRLTLSTQF